MLVRNLLHLAFSIILPYFALNSNQSNMDNISKQWLTPKDVAKCLGVCHKTILNWIQRGKLPASRVNGSRLYLVNKAHLDSVLKSK